MLFLSLYDSDSKQSSKCHLNVLIWQKKKLSNLGEIPMCTDL